MQTMNGNNGERREKVWRNDEDPDIIWETEDFFVSLSEDFHGYHVVNRRTGQAEIITDQEHAAVLQIQSLQDVYDEVMEDPVRYHIRARTERREHAPIKTVQ